MFRSRFFWKLYAGYVALILATIAVVLLIVPPRIIDDSKREISEALRAEAFLLRDLATPFLEGRGEGSLQERLRSLGGQLGIRFTVIRLDGVVIADSDEEPARMVNHGNRQEILEARSGGEGTATRLSSTVGRRMMYLALRVNKEARLLGFVRSAVSLEDIDERLAALRHTLFIGAGLAAGVGLLLGFVVTRRVTGPLISMASVAESIAGGDFEVKVQVRSRDEIGKLAASFNQMSEKLRERMEALSREHGQLLAILGGMVEGVIAVDRDDRIVHMNDIAGGLLQVAASECAGKRIWELHEAREISDAIAGAARSGEEVAREIQINAGARVKTIEACASRLLDDRGLPVGAVVVLHDVTDLRRLEVVRREFVANVSHELKTPLTAIRGLVETLIEDRDMDAHTHRRFLEKVRDQVGRLSNLVADLLTLSRVESKEVSLDRELLDLRDPVEESARDLIPVGEEKGLRIDVQLPPSPIQFLGDAEALRKVVDNLLDNAIKYTPAGGRVCVRLRSESRQAIIEVEDSGIGIHPQEQERIFERFYRVDKARSRELGGTGLGLSIVKHLCLALGGEVSVTSAPGEGSRFQVRLPLALPTE